MPPDSSGSRTAASRSVTMKPPMPWGPKRPLCPAKPTASTPQPFMSTGKSPALWAQSTMTNTPRSRHRAAACATGITVPQTLEAWVITSARVLGRNSPGSASRRREPSRSQGMQVTSTPCCSSWRRGRITALCSMEVVSTWSPGRSRPLSRMFMDAVTPLVKMTFYGLSKPSSPHSFSRVSSTTSAAE